MRTRVEPQIRAGSNAGSKARITSSNFSVHEPMLDEAKLDSGEGS